MKSSKFFLKPGNGHQYSNRSTALQLLPRILPGVEKVADNIVSYSTYGTCHFASYTHPAGAMISTPGRADNEFGQMDWHRRDHIMLFRDVGDGRGIIYIAPIKPLFALRTIGAHGVKWVDILQVSVFKKVFKFAEL